MDILRPLSFLLFPEHLTYTPEISHTDQRALELKPTITALKQAFEARCQPRDTPLYACTVAPPRDRTGLSSQYI